MIVADNGSTDGSQQIALSLGARLVPVAAKGYGNALMGGIAAARGTYVLMGDADDSYDFLEVPKFVDKLREGYDIVQCCRLPRGGGTVERGAMPFLHRRVGNPGLTLLVRTWFHAPIHDVYCGMRAAPGRLDRRGGQALERAGDGGFGGAVLVVHDPVRRGRLPRLRRRGREAFAVKYETRSDGKDLGPNKFIRFSISIRITDGTDDQTVSACWRMNPAGSISLASGTTCSEAPASHAQNISKTETSKDVSENCPTRSAGPKLNR